MYMYIVKIQLSLSYKAPPTKATPLIRPDVRGTDNKTTTKQS